MKRKMKKNLRPVKILWNRYLKINNFAMDHQTLKVYQVTKTNNHYNFLYLMILNSKRNDNEGHHYVINLMKSTNNLSVI
jgi:hypothetical protein